jgi:Uma2 family endonuclease
MSALLHLDAESLPVSLVWDPPLPDEEFEALCFSNDWIQFERSRDGDILMHAPAGDDTGSANSEINRQLGNWWHTHERGRVYDSSTGFFLGDGSMYSPAAAYVLPEKLGPREKRGRRMARHCPDFVIELLSQSDRLPKLQAKMRNWIGNGASLAWLIDPYQRQVAEYRSGSEPRILIGPVIAGSGPVEGFSLDLAKVWRFYET